MFEKSKANLALFELEPVVTFAEKLLKFDPHVVHNNSFRTPPGGGISGWHQDDPPMYLVTEGEPPKNVRLPVMLFTANYYLTDVEDPKYGTTEVIPGSHLFGASPPVKMEGTKWEPQIVPCVGRAGRRWYCSTTRSGTAAGRIKASACVTLHKSATADESSAIATSPSRIT